MKGKIMGRNKNKSSRDDNRICLKGAVMACLLIFPVWIGSAAHAQVSVSKDIEAPVDKSVDTRQSTQAAREKWDAQRQKLAEEYDRLKAENEQLAFANENLTQRADDLEESNQALSREKEEAERIRTELAPFLADLLGRLKSLAAADAPFLSQERKDRLARLAVILDDPEITIAEKYRKMMEALFVEAEYGNTVEVYREKIVVDGTQVLADIFRMGRVALFFLALDRESAGIFDVAKNQWHTLDKTRVPAIEAVVEMAAKHRPMEVVTLPIGAIAPERGDLQ
jgi:FtsZ-binding cell division protein ZapB